VTLVVDASVSLKWFIDEDRREEARTLLIGGEPLVAPDLIVPEVMNAAWKAVRRRAIPRELAESIAVTLPRVFAQIVSAADLAPRALEIALAIDHPVYDGFYVALAEDFGTELLTADDRLLSKTRRTKFAKFVRPLVP
jgi:predicted nucleic acid-binding protein